MDVRRRRASSKWDAEQPSRNKRTGTHPSPVQALGPLACTVCGQCTMVC